MRLSKVALALLILGAVGCGKTNPTEDYKNLPTNPYEIKSRPTNKQAYAPSGFLNIEVVGDSEYNFGNFFEGKPGQVKIRVTPYPGLSSYALTGTNFPDSKMDLHPSPNEANTWILSWNPAIGTVPGVLVSKSFKLHFIAAPKTNDPQFSNMVGERDLDITVSRNLGAPVITGISGFQDSVDEGGSFDFSVQVENSYNASSPPDIVPAIFDPNNKENRKFSGFIQPTGIDGANGKWTAKFTFSTAGFSLDQSKLKGTDPNRIKVCAKFIAIKDKASNSAPKCTDIIASIQAPQISIENPPVNAPIEGTPIVLTAGKTEIFSIVASVPNKRGTAAIEILTKDFEKWPGHPTMACANGDNNDAAIQKCTVTWAIPCSVKNTKPRLQFQAYNGQLGINSKAKKAPATFRDIVINPAAAGCVDATAAPAIVTAPAPAKAPDVKKAAADKKIAAHRPAVGAKDAPPQQPVALAKPGDPNKVAHFAATDSTPKNDVTTDAKPSAKVAVKSATNTTVKAAAPIRKRTSAKPRKVDQTVANQAKPELPPGQSPALEIALPSAPKSEGDPQ